MAMRATAKILYNGDPTGDVKTLNFVNIHGLVTSIRKTLPFGEGYGWDIIVDQPTFEALGGYESIYGEPLIPINDPIKWPHNNSTITATVL